MKRLTLFLLAALFLSAACSKEGSAIRTPEARIETGDLLFVGIPMDYGDEDMAQAIADATSTGGETNFIHTAILEVDPAGQVWVIDATLAYGVDRHPLDTLLKQFTLHRGNAKATFEVMRLQDNGEVKQYVEQAKGLLGEEYDLYFLPANGRHYCTELVYDMYVKADGSHVFECIPMNFKDSEGQMPSYWTRLFAQLGQPIPQDEPGTNPQQMHASPFLTHVMFLE